MPRDYAKAFTLFEQAAKQNDAWGLNNLGGLYEMGWGVKQDRRKALDYYREAFTKGNAHAGQNMKRLALALGGEPATASVEPTASKPEIKIPPEPQTPPDAVNRRRPSPRSRRRWPSLRSRRRWSKPEVKATVVEPPKKKAVKSDSSGDQ